MQAIWPRQPSLQSRDDRNAEGWTAPKRLTVVSVRVSGAAADQEGRNGKHQHRGQRGAQAIARPKAAGKTSRMRNLPGKPHLTSLGRNKTALLVCFKAPEKKRAQGIPLVSLCASLMIFQTKRVNWQEGKI